MQRADKQKLAFEELLTPTQEPRMTDMPRQLSQRAFSPTTPSDYNTNRNK